MTHAICCPEFKPETLQDKTHVWDKKPFIKDTVIQFLHIPLNMGSIVTRMLNKIQAAQAAPDNEDFLLLCFDPSPWKSELYMTVTKLVDGAENTTLSGTFKSHVFDGPYQAVPQWIKEMDSMLLKEHQKASKYYFHYAYCPKCVKKYHHNYCVAFAQIA